MKDRDEVLALVPEEHRDRFWRAVHRANQDFRELPDSPRGKLSRFKAIRAGCFWAFMVDAAQQEFAGTDVRVTEKNQTLTFSFKGHVLVQLKKVNQKGLARWGRTRRGTAFKMGVRLPGEPETHSVYVGYMMDKDGIRLDKIVMAKGADRPVPAWVEDLVEPDQLNLTPLTTTEEPKRSRVRAKPAVETQRFRELPSKEKENDATESA